MTDATRGSAYADGAGLGLDREVVDGIVAARGLVLVACDDGQARDVLAKALARAFVERGPGPRGVLDRPERDGGDVVERAARVGAALVVTGPDAPDPTAVLGLLDAGVTVLLLARGRDVAEGLERASESLAAGRHPRVANLVARYLWMAVAERAVPSVGGGRVACREHVGFEPLTRLRLGNADRAEWRAIVLEALASPASRTMAESAWRLRSAGLIGAAAYADVVRDADVGVRAAATGWTDGSEAARVAPDVEGYDGAVA